MSRCNLVISSSNISIEKETKFWILRLFKQIFHFWQRYLSYLYITLSIFLSTDTLLLILLPQPFTESNIPVLVTLQSLLGLGKGRGDLYLPLALSNKYRSKDLLFLNIFFSIQILSRLVCAISCYFATRGFMLFI